MKIPRHALAFALAVALSGCGDSTVLTGPDAEAAFSEARTSLESGGEINIRGTPSVDVALPVIFVDGTRVDYEGTSVLRDIRPEDIERIEVMKGCHAWGYLGGQDRNNGIILIETDGHDGTPPDLTFDENRARACSEEYERSGRFPWQER